MYFDTTRKDTTWRWQHKRDYVGRLSLVERTHSQVRRSSSVGLYTVRIAIQYCKLARSVG